MQGAGVHVWRIPNYTSMLHAAQIAFQALSGYCMDGLQTSCNNNVGVIYLATRPHSHRWWTSAHARPNREFLITLNLISWEKQ